jgi:hypothetical protein
LAVDEVEFREFFAAQYERLCWLGLLLTGYLAEAEELWPRRRWCGPGGGGRCAGPTTRP